MIKCGMSEAVITPSLGSPIPGAGSERLSAGVKDDLYVKALVLETENISIAVLAFDAIDLTRKTVEQVRLLVSRKTGIPEEHVQITSTHSHTSGPTIRTTYVNAVDETYQSWIAQKAADAAVLAWNRRREAKIGFAMGREDSIAFNRRFHMRDGTVRTNPGIGNPDIVKPEGPIDPDVPVIRIDDLENNPIGIVTCYACHADTVSGLEYSGDYPGELSRTIKRVFGSDVVSLFLQGTSGNINHIDVTGRMPIDRSQHYRIMGRILAGEAIKTREKAVASPEIDLRLKRGFVTLNYRKPTLSELDHARRVLESEDKYPKTEAVLARQAIELAQLPDETAEAEIQAVAFGPETAFVFLPGELFVEYGLAIKQQSPFRHTAVIELSNGSVSGYICTPEAYRNGGYENRIRYYSRLETEAGNKLAHRSLELLNRLKSEYM